MKDWHILYVLTALFPLVALPCWFVMGIPWEEARCAAPLGMAALLALTLWTWRGSWRG